MLNPQNYIQRFSKYLSCGVFIISLDFEMYWGVRDKRSIDQYKNNLHGIRKVVPILLDLFNANDIHATWATVGFLFFENREDVRKNFPQLMPTYRREILSPYNYLNQTNDFATECHFAPDLIKLISNYDGQEIGTHTFSHYYCLEDGQCLSQFPSVPI